MPRKPKEIKPVDAPVTEEEMMKYLAPGEMITTENRRYLEEAVRERRRRDLERARTKKVSFRVPEEVYSFLGEYGKDNKGEPHPVKGAYQLIMEEYRKHAMPQDSEMSSVLRFLWRLSEPYNGILTMEQITEGIRMRFKVSPAKAYSLMNELFKDGWLERMDYTNPEMRGMFKVLHKRSSALDNPLAGF